MAPQLPLELIDIIVDHHSSDNETLLSLVSASRQFKRARRYLYRRVCITFEPRDPKRGLPLFRFQELLAFYGTDISRYVQSIELRQTMLIMKGSYGRRKDVRKLREVLDLLIELSDMKLDFRDPIAAAGNDNMFKALALALASPRVQSITLVGYAYGSTPKQSSQLLLSQFSGLKTLVLSHCPPERLEAFRFPSEHGIEHVYILPWISPYSSAQLHTSRVGPTSAYWKWGWMHESPHPKLTVQLLQNLTAVIVDARNCKTIGAQLTSLASSLSCPGNRMRRIGFVFAGTSYKGVFASPQEANAWMFFISQALQSGVQTMCITFAPNGSATASVEAPRMQLMRSQCEKLLAGADPLGKLKVRYAALRDGDELLSSDCCLLLEI